MHGHPILLAGALLGSVVLAGCVGEPPEGLECEAKVEGNFLTWESDPNATAYRVYRAVNGTNESTPQPIGNTTDTRFLDTNVTAGQTYTYWVTVVRPEGESFPDSCTLTAIPVFPGLLVGAVALVGGVGAYAWFRKHR